MWLKYSLKDEGIALHGEGLVSFVHKEFLIIKKWINHRGKESRILEIHRSGSKKGYKNMFNIVIISSVKDCSTGFLGGILTKLSISNVPHPLGGQFSFWELTL